MKVTGRTTIAVELRLSLQTIARLEKVCRSGLPDPMTAELRDAIEELVCKAINPLRPLAALE